MENIQVIFPSFYGLSCKNFLVDRFLESFYCNEIDCKAGTTAKGQNLLANISTSRTSLLQGQY